MPANPPPLFPIFLETSTFYNWQKATFGHHGAQGVHIGPHATPYTDVLLSDMGLRTGHVRGGIPGPTRFLREWFRPMFPAVYEALGRERRERDEKRTRVEGERMRVTKGSCGGES